jgi:lipid II:glycine glycyltransferase (peptidoglycan interpeptide bridge formation enzyme)
LLGNPHPSISFYTHSLDLTPGAGRVFDCFESSVRRAIRKAEKSGLQIEVVQSEAGIRDFYRLQCRTRRRHGLPPQPLAFFLNIHRHIISKDLGFLITGKLNQSSVAASLYLKWGTGAYFKFGASDDRFQEFRGANLVMWAAIQKCMALGLHQLQFGRTSLRNDGLRRFKLGWGASEQMLSYFKFDLRKNQYVTDTDHASGWHNRLFASLPLPLLRLTGKILYPHLA